MHLFVWLWLNSTFAGMDGTCKDFADVAEEMALWSHSPLTVSSKTRPLLEMGKKLKLKLEPQKSLNFPVAPEKLIIKNGIAYGGIFSLMPTSDGTVRLALGRRAWTDVVDPSTNTLIKAAGFEMQTGCDKMVKVVSYKLSPGKKYLLQINSSPEPELEATLVGLAK